MSQQRFRVQTRYVLLTYAQCGDLDPWAVHDVITSFPAECLIARETHANGGTHLHAFIDFGRRVDIRDPRRFDVEGFHPNIQPCGRTPQKMLDYAIKDGDVVAGGLSPIIDDPIPTADNVSVLDRIVQHRLWCATAWLYIRVVAINIKASRVSDVDASAEIDESMEMSSSISVSFSCNETLSWKRRNNVVNSPFVEVSALGVGEEDIAGLDAEAWLTHRC